MNGPTVPVTLGHLRAVACPDWVDSPWVNLVGVAVGGVKPVLGRSAICSLELDEARALVASLTTAIAHAESVRRGCKPEEAA